jgi:hypothetical protein
MITRKLNWTDFKVEVTNRNLLLQGEDDNGSYYINATDGPNEFRCEIEQVIPASTDQLDFEANYMPTWNAQLEFRDGLNKPLTHNSPRPLGTATYITGAGDNGGLGSGNRLMFLLKDSDASKVIDLTMTEDVYAYTGTIQSVDAPFGSYLEFEVLAGGVVMAGYVKRVPLIKDNVISFVSKDVDKIPLGAQIRCRVVNSDGSDINGEVNYPYDAAKEFRVGVFINLYRSTLT